jgi:hypothetical protein
MQSQNSIHFRRTRFRSSIHLHQTQTQMQNLSRSLMAIQSR